ncbi:MAG: S1 RNA-binding domain-containing protein [Bacillus sp. (in: firmicutes)]
MSKMIAGKTVTLRVDRRAEFGHFLTDYEEEVLLHNNEKTRDVKIGDEVEVFLFHDKYGRLTATMNIPEIQLDVYGWGEVEGYRRNLGAFVNIGISKDMLVSLDELPLHSKVWPKKGDKLYITLVHDKSGRLFGKLANEDVIRSISKPAPAKIFNQTIKGYVYKTKKVGSFVISDEGYRCFIHENERGKEPRLGEYVEGRVIDVKEDGSLNLSFLPFKQDKMEEDSEIILQYMMIRGGAMPYSDKSSPEEIMEQFEMSKASFKRALGRLMKEGKIYQEDGWSYTSDRK